MSLDVLPADVPAEYAPAMVAACSDALADGRCAMAQTLPESTQPEAVALVLWQGDAFLQVNVRVGRGGGLRHRLRDPKRRDHRWGRWADSAGHHGHRDPRGPVWSGQ